MLKLKIVSPEKIEFTGEVVDWEFVEKVTWDDIIVDKIGT